MKTTVCAAVALGLTMCAAAPAGAQPSIWEDVAFVNVNLGLQPGARPFVEQQTPAIYGQPATVAADHAIDGGLLLLDVAGGVRVWRSLGVGGGFVKYASKEAEVPVRAQVPRPLPPGPPRTAVAAAEMERVESAINVVAVWVAPITDHLDIAFSAGPSFMSIEQDLVGAIAVEEASPTFATVDIAEVAVVRAKKRIVGTTIGADVTWFLTPMVGVGVALRHVRGSTDLPLSDGSSVTVSAGGFQLGFGVRLRVR